ncbi:MAG: hypothetical protein C4530_12590 [Desulfobacteraceae bacterium]|nr:MAG: hypothetical protein C4530_12590 [Desulfobacteraceae bacterium]
MTRFLKRCYGKRRMVVKKKHPCCEVRAVGESNGEIGAVPIDFIRQRGLRVRASVEEPWPVLHFC